MGVRGTCSINHVNTLQFIDSMTGRLAWPLAAVVLGLMFRRSLIALIGRIRKFRVREVEAELALVEETSAVETALKEATQPPPRDGAYTEMEQRERVERLLESAAQWGFRIRGLFPDSDRLPPVQVAWADDGSTQLRVAAGPRLAPRCC